MPLELPRVGIQREHAIGVEIVPRTRAAIEIRRRIASAPIQSIKFRVVGSGHPGGAAPTQISIARPTFRAGLAGGRYGPKAPSHRAGLRIESRNEPTYAVVSPGGADDYFVFDDERRARGSVVFVSFRVGDVPK